MFNKMKRFMAILLSLTMLLSAMPMNALAETFSSGWTSAVDDGISLLADDANYTMNVGSTLQITGEYSFRSHRWVVDTNSASYIEITRGAQDRTVTIRALAPTTGATITHYYGVNSSETFTIAVTGDCTITFNLNGGSGTTPDSITAEIGETITLPTDDGITRTNYTLLGWSTERDANTVDDNTATGGINGKPEVYPLGDFYEVTGSTTLYAVWAQTSGRQSGTITVAVRANGVIPGEPSIQYEDYFYIIQARHVNNVLDYFNPAQTTAGTAAVEAALTGTFWQEFSQALARFSANGWNYDPETQEIRFYVIKYQGNDSIWHIDGVIIDKTAVHLYYDGNGNTGGLVPDSEQVSAGTQLEVAQPGNYYDRDDWRELTRTGYTFVGWNTARDGSGASYQPGESITINEDTTLYAQWRANNATEYTIEYYFGTGDDLTEYAPNETLQRSVTATGTTDTLADYSEYQPGTIENYTYVAKADDFFSYDAENNEYTDVNDATILADGSLVVRLFYKLSTGSLTLVKAMAADSAAPSAGDSFNLNYDYTLEDGTKVEGTVVATWNGTETGFTYTINGETGNTIDGIPVGTTVSISESGASNYTPAYSAESVTIEGSETAVIVTNTRKEGRVGYNLVLAEANKSENIGSTWVSNPTSTAPYKYVDNANYYSDGDTYTVTSIVPQADGWAFVGWLDKEYASGEYPEEAEILQPGYTDIWNRGNTDEKIQTLDAVWARLVAESTVFVYDGQGKTIGSVYAGYNDEGYRDEYLQQISGLVSVSDITYTTADGYSDTVPPTYTNVGTYTVTVSATVNAGGRPYELSTTATVTIYPRLVVEKTLAEGETATDEAFTFVLTKDGEPVPGAEYVVTGSSETPETDENGSFTLAAGQTATFTGEGIDIASYPGTYTVTEDVENGWVAQSAQTANLDLPASGNEVKLTFTNSRSTQQITITKTWEDGDNQDGLRPEPSEFSVTLTDETNSSNAHTVSSWAESSTDSNVWTATITVPAYTDNGTAITYEVSESAVSGYTMSGDTSVVPADNTTVAITNTHTTATTSVSVEKVWDDYGNKDGTRLSSVIVALYNGTTQVRTAELSEDNGWKVEWTDLPTNASGSPIDYIVRELNAENNPIEPNGTISSVVAGESYVVTYSKEDVGNAWTVTNTYTTSVKVSGTKTWDGLEKGETAPTVTVQLQKWDSDSDEWTPVTDVATQEVDNEGTYTFSDLPKYEQVGDDYVEVRYRVVELNPEEGVTPSGGTKDEDGNYNLTNTMDTTSVTITKVWDDQDNKYGLRPSTTDFTVTLTDQANANRTYTASDWTVSEDDSNVWTVTIDNVRTHDVAGNKLTYTVSENVEEPYTVSYSPETIKPANEDERTVTVTNTLKTMNVVVNKTWDLNGIELEEYPEIKLELRHDNQMVAETTLTTTDLTGSVTFANVPYREEGYTVVETSITGGTFPEGTLNAPSGGVASLFPTLASAEVVLVDGKYTASLTNTAKDGSGNELGAMTVTKVLDLNDTTWATGAAYPTFAFTVKGAYGGDVELSLTPDKNDGTISATSGQILAVVGASVTVDEVTQPGWTADKTSDKVTIGETPANVTFTNTRDVVTSLTVTKVWDVPADMTMPTPALSVEITRSVEGGTGETVVAGIALSESNEWSWTAEGTFPTHDENGNAYIYSATEEAADPAEQSVLAQYDLTVGTAKPAEGGTKIVLTNAISDEDTATVTVQKVVVDESGTTPNDKTFAISYTVNSNGTQVASGTLELANNGSQDIIVPKGAKVTVTETPGEGWTVSYSNNDGTAFNENGTITVTNTRKSTSVDVTKVWNDNGNAYQTRPSVADFEGMLALYSTTVQHDG